MADDWSCSGLSKAALVELQRWLEASGAEKRFLDQVSEELGRRQVALELQTLEAEALALAWAIHRRDKVKAGRMLVVLMGEMGRRGVLHAATCVNCAHYDGGECFPEYPVCPEWRCFSDKD